MIKNIYFIDRFPFNKDFFIRNEFAFLQECGFEVKFLDISQFLKRQKIESTLPDNLNPYRNRIRSKKMFNQFIADHCHDSIVVSTVPFIASSAWMYASIFKHHIPYILVENVSFPQLTESKIGKDRRLTIVRFFKRLNLKKVINKPIESFYYYKSQLTSRSAKMIISSRIDSKSKFNRFVGNDTVLRYSFSPDYKSAKKVKNNHIVKGDYAVFIDQYFCHHPDFKTNHIIHSFNSKEYYGELNTFLSSFQKKTGLKVVIASHPRRNKKQEKDFNSDFEIHYNKTAELIKYSKTALMHFSTSISFAVIFRKPFILLNSPMFVYGTIGHKIRSFASYFERPDVNMRQTVEDQDMIENKLFDVDEKKYTLYKNSFLKHPRAKHETFGEKINGFVNKYNKHLNSEHS